MLVQIVRYIIKMKNKFILDACCGGRMMWFDKHHPNTIYIDNRTLNKGEFESRPNFDIQPDVIMDFRELKYPDKSFKLIVLDPPHLKTLGETSKMRKQFGGLNSETWQYDLSKGFNECWRVLGDYGVLIFKWSVDEISLKQILALFKQQPLFGHSTGTKLKTKWMCFMKIPDSKTGRLLPSNEENLIAVKKNPQSNDNNIVADFF